MKSLAEVRGTCRGLRKEVESLINHNKVNMVFLSSLSYLGLVYMCVYTQMYMNIHVHVCTIQGSGMTIQCRVYVVITEGRYPGISPLEFPTTSITCSYKPQKQDSTCSIRMPPPPPQNPPTHPLPTYCTSITLIHHSSKLDYNMYTHWSSQTWAAPGSQSRVRECLHHTCRMQSTR